MVSERPGSENYETTEQQLITSRVFIPFHSRIRFFNNPGISPRSGPLGQTPGRRVHAPKDERVCAEQARRLPTEFGHDRLQKGSRCAAPPAALTCQARDAARPRAGRRKDAGGRPRPAAAARTAANTPRRLAGRGLGAAPRRVGGVLSPRRGRATPGRLPALGPPGLPSVERGAAAGARRHDTVATLGRLAPLRRPQARRPYHSTRRNSSKIPGKTKSSLPKAQRRPKSTIPGMAKAAPPASGRPAARRAPPRLRALPAPQQNTARPRAGAPEGGARRMRTPRPSLAHAAGTSGCAGGLYLRCARVRSPSC